MSTKRKPKFDICAEYTEDSKNLLENTEKLFESFIRFKFEYIKNKSKELEQRKKSTQNKINNKESETYIIGNIQKTQQISGIYINPQEKLRKHINKLPKHSFIIWFRFKLKAPYFSKDNDEIYIIQNPILKETNFKTPMIRGSGWKGALAHAFRELINESKWEEKKSKIESFLRIFGAGSESIKTLEKYLKNKTANLKEFKENFLAFILFELGLEINKDSLIQIKEADSYKDISNKIAEYVWKKYKEIKNSGFLPLEFQTHKGRAIFYPTYFNKLSLEIINPHEKVSSFNRNGTSKTCRYRRRYSGHTERA